MNELNIAKTLLRKRKEKGITQDELANYIGVSKAAVSKWETGQSYPDIMLLPQLAAYFNITVDALIGYEPQMVKEDIKNLYYRLCKDFTCKPFDQVTMEIREITKKYYSCFPLLLQMGILLINHYDLVEKENQESFIQETLALFIHIKISSDDVEINRQAKCLEAICYLTLNQPKQVIDLLQDSNFPMLNETTLLAQGQMLNGNLQEATATLQIGAYQALISLLMNLTGLLQYADVSQTTEINQRIKTICKTFELDTLSPSSMFSVYLTQAQIYCLHGQTEEALATLQKYVDLAIQTKFPLIFHGDTFFNQLKKWLDDLNMGINITRDATIIKKGLIAAIRDNPAFATLKDSTKYQFLMDKLLVLENE